MFGTHDLYTEKKALLKYLIKVHRFQVWIFEWIHPKGCMFAAWKFQWQVIGSGIWVIFFWESFLWLSMDHSKDNFTNNCHIFKLNYFISFLITTSLGLHMAMHCQGWFSFLLCFHMIINNLSLFISILILILININITDVKRYMLICLFVSMLVITKEVK
jgi:hypothetical protein